MPVRFSLWRSITVGSLLCCLVPVMAHLSIDIVHASHLAIDFMPVAAVFLFFVFVLVGNTGVRAVSRSAALTRPELLVVYTMLIVCASITTMGLGAQILPIMGAPVHFATPENRWAELVQPYVPGWLVPNAEAVKGFFMGIKHIDDVPAFAAIEWEWLREVIQSIWRFGQTLRSIPWGAWIRPLGWWLVFLAPAYFVMIAIMVILRKQWVEREHLIFPLTVLPAAMCEPPKKNQILGPFFRNRAMWTGFLIVFLITSTQAFHSYWDFIPEIPLDDTVKIFRNTTNLVIRMSFPILGFTFLISKDLSFSLWFFNLVFLCISGYFNMRGIRLDENLGIYGSRIAIFAYIGMGAIVAFVLGGLYNAREHLKGVFRRVIWNLGGADDSDEILSYPKAVWGIAFSLMIMCVWLSLAGLHPLLVLLYLFFTYVLFLGLTRIVSEGGLATIVAAMIAPTVLISMFGISPPDKPGMGLIGASGLAVLALMYVWSADIRIFPMAECIQGLKLTEDCPKRGRRGIFWAMVIALVISLVVSLVVSMGLSYDRGGISLNSWFFRGGPMAPFRLMAEKLKNPSPPSGAGYGLMSAGALVTVCLAVLRASFSWFTLHPIGFAVGSVWLVDFLWFSIFLAWLFKSLILRYGGPSLYKRAVPFFLGLAMGQYFAAAFWFIVDLCTGKIENSVFWI